MEKAHPDVLELFFQVFDKGQMEDGEGREIDFKNTIILLTSNAGTNAMMKFCADPETMPTAEGIVKAIKPELNKIFKPAFLGRLVIIPYYPVRDEALKKIITLKLGKIQKHIRENHYSNIFHSIPFGLVFRPPDKASKLLVRGCQIAAVVGPSGEEIYSDKYGRIKVQFHWDREGKNDASSSCWVRVASFWAGNNWGAVHIPHRSGGNRRFPRRRSGLPDRRGQRVQRYAKPSMDPARQSDSERH